MSAESKSETTSLRELVKSLQSENQSLQDRLCDNNQRLASGIAFELNNILVPIFGYTEILMKETDRKNPDWEKIAQIHRAAERARELTTNLLAFSGKQFMELKTVNLSSLLEAMKPRLRKGLASKVDLDILLDKKLDPVKVDPAQIEATIFNMIRNAGEMMFDGGILSIKTENILIDQSNASAYGNISNGAYVMLTVTDTGPGIGENVKKHLFEPFFSDKSLNKGSGLSLAAAHSVVKHHGGHILLDSKLGFGAAFKLLFPKAEGVAEKSPSHSPVKKSKRKSKEETILLVEDDETILNFTCFTLRSEGYTVLKARSGYEALRVCDKHDKNIHLMLVDLILPEMNGRDLRQVLSSLRPETRVIFMSGYSRKHLDINSQIDSDTSFLEKPFTTEALISKVREVLAE